jgi:hypothetical protein
MSVSIFNNKLREPDDKLLADGLLDSKKYLDRICDFIRRVYTDLNPEWKYYGKNYGWLLKLLHKNRNVMFVVPYNGYFRVVFTFGDKAVSDVIASKLPKKIKDELVNARKYAEGRSVNFDVKSDEHMESILELVRIKLAH